MGERFFLFGSQHSAFSIQLSDLAAGMLLVISISLYHPVPRLHGLFAVGFVLLRVERSGVGCQLTQVVLAGLHRRGYLREAGVRPNFVRRLRRRAGYRTNASDVEAAAVRTLGRGYTVGSENHLLVCCVRGLFVDLG